MRRIYSSIERVFKCQAFQVESHLFLFGHWSCWLVDVLLQNRGLVAKLVRGGFERKESLARSNSQPIPAFSPLCNSQPDHSLTDHRTCTSYYFLELSSISKYCTGSLLHEASTCGRQPIVSKPKCVIKLFPPSEYVFQNTHMHVQQHEFVFRKI